LQVFAAHSNTSKEFYMQQAKNAQLYFVYVIIVHILFNARVTYFLYFYDIFSSK